MNNLSQNQITVLVMAAQAEIIRIEDKANNGGFIARALRVRAGLLKSAVATLQD